jgi:threonine/homoserine/homoserine lactone efflux protein
MSTSHWLALLPAGLALALMPGPNNLLGLRVAAARGAGAACRAGLGRLAAFGLVLLAGSFGLAALLAHTPALAIGVQSAAALYLLVLAWYGWSDGGLGIAAAGASPGGDRHAWRREFWVALGNPKGLMIATAFVPQFVRAGEPALPQLAAASALVLVLEAGAVLAYALGGAVLARRLVEPAAARAFGRSCAMLMALAALWLLARTWA